MFELEIIWCEAHGHPYKIVNNRFYWQTFIQTGEAYQDENGIPCINWYPKNFFDEI